MLSVTGVSKTFFPGTANERRALNDLTLTLGEGDFVTVIGSRTRSPGPPRTSPSRRTCRWRCSAVSVAVSGVG